MLGGEHMSVDVDVVQLPLTFTAKEGIRSCWKDWTEKFNGDSQKLIVSLREKRLKFPAVQAENGQVSCMYFLLFFVFIY